MPNSSLNDQLRHAFPKSNKERWTQQASQELKGAHPLEALQWKTRDDLTFLPYYDAQDVSALDYLKNFSFPASTKPQTHARAWQNLSKITVYDAVQANSQALENLATGADGVLFDLREAESVNVEILLNDIDWRYCNISFMVNASAKKIVSVLGDYWHQHSLDPAAIEGSIFWDGIPQLDSMELDPFLHQMEFHTLGIVVSDATPVQEIATALAQATVIMDRLTDLGLNKAVVLSHISFSMRLETDFFIAIAKLKALRMLWFQLACAFEIRDVDPAALEIHGWVAPWKQETMEPHSNLLKGTTAALAAVLGGCNGITVSPEDENNTLMTRIARNVSVLFQDEAHLGMVADPLAGAYAQDVLVDRTAAAAWQMFQQMMKNQ